METAQGQSRIPLTKPAARKLPSIRQFDDSGTEWLPPDPVSLAREEKSKILLRRYDISEKMAGKADKGNRRREQSLGAI